MLFPLSPLLKQHRLCITKASSSSSSSSQRCSFASGDFKRKRRLIIESPSEATAQHIKQTTVFDPFPTFEAPERFGYEADRDGHWYVGHMMRTKQALPAWANRVDVVIEIRDARIPLTSAQTELNSNLRQAGIRKLPRLVVLNKCDLVTPSMARRAQEMIEAHSNAKCILATSVLKKGVVKIKEFMLSEREIRFQSLGIYGLHRKSTTINALKRLALLASKTRYDSRGMMAGVSRAQARYVNVCGLSGGPTNDIRSVCREIAFQLTNDPCRDSGAMDVLSGARTFLKFYRNGLLGRYCLDALPSEGELSRYNDLVEEAEPPGPWGPNAYPLDERAAILTSYS
ncbi:Mitochondrial GTPase [Perkinsus olseni]|uniref:Mitochondrial GTPase n=1 Tax=Perkinsus olseni TaxID=32597 RepID=A0A7J6P370_PEROL|nr:Mitochondrial GTPase [Perkinsus olseni]